MDELDAGQSSSSDVPQDCRPRGSDSLTQVHARRHASWPQQSVSNIHMERDSNRSLHPAAVSYHDGDIVRHRQSNNAPSPLPFFAYPSSSPFASRDDSVPHLGKSSVSMDRDFGDQSSSVQSVQSIVGNEQSAYCMERQVGASTRIPSSPRVSMEQDLGDQSSSVRSVQSIAGNERSAHRGEIQLGQSAYCGERRLGAPITQIASSSPVSDDDQSVTNANCVPVVGRLADLAGDDARSDVADDDDEDDGGGILIVEESTEEEYAESMRAFAKDNSAQRKLLNSSQFASTARCGEESSKVFAKAPVVEADSIDYAAAARVNADPAAIEGNASIINASLDFEQLLREADNQSEAENILPDTEEEGEEDAREDPGPRPWRLNPFASPNKRSRTAVAQASRTPVRATRISHDKYVVEVDVFPLDTSNPASDTSNPRLDVRDAMDIMGNIELLPMWFDPVPAVFDAVVKDGSGNGASSPPTPRRYDGQWVEISTPPLSIPSDSRVSGFLRAVRVGFRSLVGFPSRIRSMIFVERSCARIGMTIGPYPDGYLCNGGTMAYHTFNIRTSDEEGSNAENGGHVVVSDEVRLQRDGDEGLDGTRSRCSICSILRFLFGLLEWAFVWYQPDLASYMQQTISSMNRLRALVERGESAAYARGNPTTNGSDNADAMMGTPLLG